MALQPGLAFLDASRLCASSQTLSLSVEGRHGCMQLVCVRRRCSTSFRCLFHAVAPASMGFRKKGVSHPSYRSAYCNMGQHIAFMLRSVDQLLSTCIIAQLVLAKFLCSVDCRGEQQLPCLSGRLTKLPNLTSARERKLCISGVRRLRCVWGFSRVTAYHSLTRLGFPRSGLVLAIIRVA